MTSSQDTASPVIRDLNVVRAGNDIGQPLTQSRSWHQEKYHMFTRSPGKLRILDILPLRDTGIKHAKLTDSAMYTGHSLELTPFGQC